MPFHDVYFWLFFVAMLPYGAAIGFTVYNAVRIHKTQKTYDTKMTSTLRERLAAYGTEDRPK